MHRHHDEVRHRTLLLLRSFPLSFLRRALSTSTQSGKLCLPPNYERIHVPVLIVYWLWLKVGDQPSSDCALHEDLSDTPCVRIAETSGPKDVHNRTRSFRILG
eukprot:761560-Hanusia_phi.AAC.3